MSEITDANMTLLYMAVEALKGVRRRRLIEAWAANERPTRISIPTKADTRAVMSLQTIKARLPIGSFIEDYPNVVNLVEYFQQSPHRVECEAANRAMEELTF